MRNKDEIATEMALDMLRHPTTRDIEIFVGAFKVGFAHGAGGYRMLLPFAAIAGFFLGMLV